ncbi:MAG: polysaccharide biosynthesis C-terminal domain-containing protein, partial [Fulvivirga sp.]
AFDFYDTNTFINVYVGGQLFVSSLAFLYTLKQGKLNLGLQLNSEKIKTFKSMSRFGIVTILSGLSFFLINQVDILMVGSYIGLTDVAIYSIALYMSSVILVPAQSISRTTAVLMADAFKNDNHEMIHTLYKKTALNQMLFGSLIFMLIAINYESLMSFLRETYADSFMIFFLLGLAKIVDTAFGINGAVLISSKYYRVDTYLSIILLILSLILKVIMIPRFGIIGAAGSTALALVLFNLAKYSFLKVKLNISPFTKDYFLLCIILVISFMVVFFIPQIVNIWIDMFAKSALFCLITIPVVYVLKFSPEFNDIIDKALEMSRQVIKR